MTPGLRCDCAKNSVIVWTNVSRDGERLGGPRQLRKQCQACGALSSSALPHYMADLTTPTVDVEAVKLWNKANDEHFERRRQSFYKQRETVKDSVRAQYEAYLQTPEWRAKRDVALKRANWLCEGCGTKPATQVHHLTYLHLGDELLWELKAVCVSCHAKCHPEKKQQQNERGVA